MTLRQMSQVEKEVGKLEAEIIERGKGLHGLKRLLQIHGLNLIAAIGLLVEIGSIELFEYEQAVSGLCRTGDKCKAVEPDGSAREDNQARAEAAEDDLYKGGAYDGE